MEYRLSLTARLVALGSLSLVMLLVLFFLLGVQLGRYLASDTAAPPNVAGPGATAPAPVTSQAARAPAGASRP